MKIAVISNKQDIKNDYSQFIDSCDLVIRVSKMDNIESGKTGTKTDIVMVMGNTLYFKYNKKQRHTDILKKAKEVIFVPNRNTLMQIKLYAKLLKLENYSFFSWEEIDETYQFTTFTRAIYFAVKNFPNDDIYFLGDVDCSLRTNGASFHNSEIDDGFIINLLKENKIKPILTE